MSFEFRFSAIAGSLLKIISTGLLGTILVYHCFVKDDTYVCMDMRLKLIGNKKEHLINGVLCKFKKSRKSIPSLNNPEFFKTLPLLIKHIGLPQYLQGFLS
ncbi:hypothetical protein GCM10009597_31650 [Peribacillus frigoritolerans]